jgi:uncharacterized OB-fold protein
MMSNIVTADVESIAIGQRVRVTWEDQESGIALPLFAPV